MTALIIGGFDAPSSRSPALGGPWDYYGFRRTGHKKLAELCRLPRHDPRGKITSAFGAKWTWEGPTAASIRSRMPSRPRKFHPEPLTDPDLILSHHPARTID